MRKKEGEGTSAPTTLVPAETTSDSVPEVVEAEAEAVVVEKPKAKRRKVKDTTKTRSVRNRTNFKGNTHVLKFIFRVPQQLGRAFYSYSLFFSLLQAFCCNPTSTMDTLYSRACSFILQPKVQLRIFSPLLHYTGEGLFANYFFGWMDLSISRRVTCHAASVLMSALSISVLKP